MKSKFKYTDLMIAGTIGAIVALVIHHEWRKSRAKAFISSIQKESGQNDFWEDLGPEDVVNMNQVFGQHQEAYPTASESETSAVDEKGMDPEQSKEGK